MTLAVRILQVLFGLWNLFFGTVFFCDYYDIPFVMPQPTGHGDLTPLLNDTLSQTGIFHIVKGVEIITGLLLISNRAVPLALCVYFPITVAIFHTNMFLEPIEVGGWIIAIIYAAVHLFLFWYYRAYYKSMLVWRT